MVFELENFCGVFDGVGNKHGVFDGFMVVLLNGDVMLFLEIWVIDFCGKIKVFWIKKYKSFYLKKLKI